MKDDCPDRRLVGCSIDSAMMVFLAVTALRGAVARHGTVAGYVVHADGVGQFRTPKVVHGLTHHELVGSTGRGLRGRHRHGVVLRPAPEERPG